MNEINLRPATVEDASELGVIYAAAFNGAYDDEKWSDENAQSYISEWIAKQPDLFWVAEVNGRVIGGVAGEVMTVDVGPCLREVELFVDPSCHRSGVGKLLLRKLLIRALEKYSIKAVTFSADRRRTFPYDWYNKIGMRGTGWVSLWGAARGSDREIKLRG